MQSSREEPKSATFEAALARLEEIAQNLERPDIGLDDSVRLFKEGKELAARCERLLREAQTALEQAAAEPAPPAPNGASGSLFDV
jgi:exodeoxyribonuclease VII small subunit